MHTFVAITICSALLYPNALGIYFRNFSQDLESKHYNFVPNEFQNDTLNIFDDSSEIITNASENQTHEQPLKYFSTKYDASESFRVQELNSTFSSEPSTQNVTNTQSIQTETSLSNESNSTGSVPVINSTSSSTGSTKSSIKSTSIVSSTKEEISVPSTEDEEQEGVVRGTPSTTEITNTTTSKSETMYQKALALISDTYTLSILLPVAAGIIFASTIIITIVTCRCLKRQCRRRRLRRKTLPDSVKHLRPSDRARLLAESSDEEF